MKTGNQQGQPLPRSPGVDTRPVVLALVDGTTASLASLLLAAEIARAQDGRLYVAHISPPRVWLGAIAAIPEPVHLLAEADHDAADQLRERVGDILALGTPVDWTFTWTRGRVHRTVTRLASQLSPAAVVVSEPRRHRIPARPSLARWLIGRPNIRAVVTPA